MIEAKHLRKVYGDLIAVDDVSFGIPRGVVFGLLGPNGAGKTTTINMLVGLLSPDNGEVIIEGSGDPRRASARLQIGGAPQALAIYEDLTAEENIRFFGRLYGLSGRRLRERVDWSLDTAGLQERRATRVSTFSGGMKRRLNLVCALVHDPPIIVLDEPTVGVDPQSRNMIFEKIELLKREGRTIVYTTHYMEEAQRLCDQVAIIDHGRLLDIDATDNLITRHGGTSVVSITLAQPPAAELGLQTNPDGVSLRFETSTPVEDVAALASRGLQFRTLHVDRPDLESVFLNLTGRSLRDT